MKQGPAQLSYSRYLAAVVTIALSLAYPVSLSHGQQKRAAPPPPAPNNNPFGNPFGQLGEELKQKSAETTISALLNNGLPLKLDANAVYPTVARPPGGPFAPTPLTLSAADLDRSLPPGDYTLNMLAYCTEYSVHRPGAGVAYRLGPVQGKAAGAIGDLLWRGTLQTNLQPQQLQAVSWAIQSGLRYDQMPKTYQSVIDNVIPDHKNELNGDFFQSMADSYNNLAKGTKLPPLQQVLAGMGKSGQLALSADRQRQALLRQNTTDQIKEQTLFAGQEQGVYTPVRAEEGPWTERIPGVAYLRYKIVGGNLARNNVMEIRVLPKGGVGQAANIFGHRSLASLPQAPRSVYGNFFLRPASFSAAKPALAAQPQTPPATSPRALIGGSIGCAVGAGAQCLIPVPATASCDMPCAGRMQRVQGQVQIQRGNNVMTLKPGDQINMGDKIMTGLNSGAEIDVADGTKMTLGEKTSLAVDEYVYDPSNPTPHSGIFYRWLEGAFVWTSSKLGPPKSNEQIELPPGTLGIRGTEFVAIMNSTGDAAEIDLIDGKLAITPKVTKRETLFTAPTKIAMTAASATGAPLSPAEYEAAKTRVSPSKGAGGPSQ